MGLTGFLGLSGLQSLWDKQGSIKLIRNQPVVKVSGRKAAGFFRRRRSTAFLSGCSDTKPSKAKSKVVISSGTVMLHGVFLVFKQGSFEGKSFGSIACQFEAWV